ncbi:MAG: ATP synthase protein I [Rugosibacter sp.]|nr:ATP synthase protein I [Rugosibacter sp.]
MSQPRPLVDRSQALQLLKWQCALAVVLMLAAGLVAGMQALLSAGLGCGIAIAGSVYFALQAFRHAGATQAQQIVQGFYKGEAGKFVITVLLFAAVFAWVKAVLPGWLLSVFILEQLVAWGVLLAGTIGPKK